MLTTELLLTFIFGFASGSWVTFTFLSSIDSKGNIVKLLDYSDKIAAIYSKILNYEKDTKEALAENLSFQRRIASKVDRISEQNHIGFFKSIPQSSSALTKEFARVGDLINDLSVSNSIVKKDLGYLCEIMSGRSKNLGFWGEQSLLNLLTAAGFEQGRDFFTQQRYMSEDQVVLIPDLIVKINESLQLIIDSKAITSYFMRSCYVEPRKRHGLLKQHAATILACAKGLASRDYPRYVPNAFSYVIMFLPIESAYCEIVKSFPDIYEQLLTKYKIILVGPSSLTVFLRTISAITLKASVAKKADRIYAELQNVYGAIENKFNELNTVSFSAEKQFYALENIKKSIFNGPRSLKEMIKKINE